MSRRVACLFSEVFDLYGDASLPVRSSYLALSCRGVRSTGRQAQRVANAQPPCLTWSYWVGSRTQPRFSSLAYYIYAPAASVGVDLGSLPRSLLLLLAASIIRCGCSFPITAGVSLLDIRSASHSAPAANVGVDLVSLPRSLLLLLSCLYN